ncbi:PAS domain S-box-containing protein [Pseudomonas sp. JUb42]|jgi:PAS domain S-box-containing protein|uniref:response regulator n=1 Tax=Pseudomonas sp. JUb42 TaxID=2940611 RepID=UPI002167CD97|nr:response regulator [Pseudomonas sp. JUb42]MCS3471613.1 PAS domain S-box-containing protein [Pseudomonas sp. JUb42]
MPLAKVKLLLVEDSIYDVELTLLTLEANGLQVEPVVVHDHLSAAEALGREKFDVIVCDVLLPSSSGTEVLEVAKRIVPQTPFIFLSGMFGEQQAIETMRLGAVDYVLKQNLKVLPKAIRRAVLEVREREKRHAAESALEDVEARARIAIQAAEMGVWEVNIDTLEVIWDERCRALYELPPVGNFQMGPMIDLTHPDDRDALQEKINLALSQASAFNAEYRIVLPGNRIRWLLSNGRSTFRDGRCVQFTGVIQDISERRVATQELVQLTETLGQRVEQRTRERDRTWELSRELLAVLRFDMTPIAFNPAWESALGWSREQINSLRLWELIHPLDLDATIKETQSIASGNVSTRFVNRMRHSNGDYRWLSWTIVPENGLMYAAVRDITEERAVIEELAAANKHLQEQIKERERVEATLQQMQRLEVVGQLTAGVAHDFNNLLTVILTSATFASRDIERGKLDKIPTRLKHISEAGERGARLTAQLLSFSRRQRLQPCPVDLNTTIQDMQGLLSKALGANIWVDLSLSPGLWTASADPTQTEMIILNLAINARDAMASTAGSLKLRTHNEMVKVPAVRPEDPEPGRYVVFTISDTGCGMDEETLKKAYEPFFTTKAVGQGAGLGLAQVFGFAKQSGGGVRIETELNVGTTVSVYLPKIDGLSTPLTQAVSPARDARHMGTRTVLLVDDDPVVRDLTATMLESFGLMVLQASSGIDALSKLSPAVELLITDYAMPNMTGGELAALVSKAQPGIPIVFITGYADTDVLGLDNSTVVQKPFTEQQLQEKIWLAMAQRVQV